MPSDASDEGSEHDAGADAETPSDGGDAGSPQPEAGTDASSRPEAGTDASGSCVRDADCDDGIACNGAEQCAPSEPGADPATGCLAGTPVDCDDGIACTVDSCEEPTGSCRHESLDADGDGRCGTEDCAEGDPNVFLGAPERCNAVDDDCDGATDEDFECTAGSSDACTNSCGVAGTRSCSATCSWSDCRAEEVCNGCDDDGDGTADEDFGCVRDATRACTVSGCSGTQRCDATCSWGGCDLGPAPTHDRCGDTVPTISASGSFPFATCGATHDFSASCGASAASPDVVYRLQIENRSVVTLETIGPNFDTVLHLRQGSSCPGTEVVCDDDGGLGTASRIQRTLDPGTYWVVVDGFGNRNQGNGTLQATIRPVHDECASALPIALGAGRTTVRGSTATATDSTHGCGGTAGDLWYRFTLSRPEVVDLSTFGSAYDTRLALLESCTSTTGQRCNDDACGRLQSRITAVLPAGTYYVKVDGFLSRTGSFELHIEHLPTGSDGTARAIAAGTQTYMGSTSGASVVGSSCGGTSAPEDLLYWTRCPAESSSIFTATTCHASTNYDTQLHVRSGVTGNTLACNDDDNSCTYSRYRSRLSTTIPAGSGLYGLYVDGFSDDAGSYAVVTTR